MSKSKSADSVSLDHLVNGKLPRKLVDAIAQMELTVGELTEWEESKPAVRLVFTERDLVVEMRARIPMKKSVAVLGSVSGILWMVSKFLVEHSQELRQLAATWLNV